MNSREPNHDISDLLRSRKPDPRPSPGLESRILRELSSRRRGPRLWPWFLLPPAVALGMILLWPDATVSPRITRQPDRPTAPAEHPGPAELEFASNPLELEKLALQRDARRAGRFLIDCLPSLAGSE